MLTVNIMLLSASNADSKGRMTCSTYWRASIGLGTCCWLTCQMRCRSIRPGDLSCTPESSLLPLMSLVNGIPSFPSTTCSKLLLLEICALLRCYAPYNDNSFLTFRDNLSVLCARTRNSRRNLLLLIHLSLFFLFPPSTKIEGNISTDKTCNGRKERA
jgi:hypothetical protein